MAAGCYGEVIQLLRMRLKLEANHVVSLYHLAMVCSDRMQL